MITNKIKRRIAAVLVAPLLLLLDALIAWCGVQPYDELRAASRSAVLDIWGQS